MALKVQSNAKMQNNLHLKNITHVHMHTLHH